MQARRGRPLQKQPRACLHVHFQWPARPARAAGIHIYKFMATVELRPISALVWRVDTISESGAEATGAAVWLYSRGGTAATRAASDSDASPALDAS